MKKLIRSLTWRDRVALLATMTVIGMAAAGFTGLVADEPDSWRAAAILLVILGLGAYIALGPRFLPIKEPWLTITTTLHILAIIFSVLAFIIGQRVAFMMLAGVLTGLWVSALVYHVHLNMLVSRRRDGK